MKHRISKWCVAVVSLLSVAGMFALPAAAQEETAYETWPEVDAFVKLNENSRLFFLGAGTKVKEQGYSDGALGVHLDIFTSPVLKSRLERTAHRADVARNKFLQSATEPVGGTPDDLARSARADYDKYERLIAELNIRAS